MSDLRVFHTKTDALKDKVQLLTDKLTESKQKLENECSKHCDTKAKLKAYKTSVAERLIKLDLFPTTTIAHVTKLSKNDIEILREKIKVFGTSV